ncbi:MAG: DMT family transporter [Patescibacteria group bacterium]
MKLSRGFIFSFLAALVWAVGILSTRIILSNGENPYNLTFWGMIISLPYWLLILSQHRKEAAKLTAQTIIMFLIMGLVSKVAIPLTENLALNYSSAVNFSFLIRSVILFTILFAALFLREHITKKKIILATLILSGAYLLTTKGGGIVLARGDMYILLEAALIAFGNNILGKKLAGRMHADLAAAGQFLTGVIPLALITTTSARISFPHMFPLVVLGTVTTILFYQFLFRAYQNASATYVTMILSFNPVLVALISIPFLGESLTPIQLVGGGLIVLAGILVEKLKI